MNIKNPKIHEIPYVLLADVTELQSPWERSGQFEGDIMLTEEQMRTGLINTASRWPGKTVPFFIDPVFSEYWYAGRGGKYPWIMSTALAPVHTGVGVEKVMAKSNYPRP